MATVMGTKVTGRNVLLGVLVVVLCVLFVAAIVFSYSDVVFVQKAFTVSSRLPSSVMETKLWRMMRETFNTTNIRTYMDKQGQEWMEWISRNGTRTF